MSPTVSWEQLVWRLTLTLVAGAVIGLVCLEASLAMIQMNLLAASNGKAADSFAVMDVARLPPGILSGWDSLARVRFCGAIAWCLVVNTAATLWFVTMIGLCFGGGQIGLGLAGLGIGRTFLC